jgi:ATP-dependent Clp protease ATP-binding subunit ClpB
LNRLDEIIYFKPLSRGEVGQIVGLAIKSLEERLADKRLYVSVTDAAREHIIESSYDPIYGARPLKRFISSRVETLIARKIISEDIPPETHLEVDYDGQDFVVRLV